MPGIRITEFGGVNYAKKPDSGETSRASVARNVNLEHNDLRAWRYPAIVQGTGHDKLCSAYKHKCCFIGSPAPCVSYVSEGSCNRVFATGAPDTPYPVYGTITPCESDCPELCTVKWCRLGVPAPSNAPVLQSYDDPESPSPVPVTISNYDCSYKGKFKVQDYLGELEHDNDPFDTGEYTYGGPEDFCNKVGLAPHTEPWSLDAGKQLKREPRAYVYTYVNEYGEESAPSEMTPITDIDLQGRAVIRITNDEAINGFCNPRFLRLYRVVASHDNLPTIDPQQANQIGVLSGDDLTNFTTSVDSTAFLVREIPFQVGTVDILDDPRIHDIQEELTTWEVELPLPNLKNITKLDNGSLVAHEGKNLWFTQPWEYHNWNCAMNLEDCIVNIKVVANMIYVATDAYPYVIAGTPGNVQDCSCCRQVVRLTESAPCLSAASMVATNTGVIWATSTGLVRVVGNALQIVTHSFMREDDWLAWFPHQIKAEFYKGKYFGFNEKRGFIFDINDGPYSSAYEGDSGKFTELDLTPETVFKSDENRLYMTFKGQIHEWNAADTFMPYVWRTKLNVEGGLKNFSAMKVVFGRWLRTRKSPTPVTIRLFADGKMMFERQTHCSRPFRLPKGFDALNFMIEIEGIEQINEIHMATSMNELVNLNNS